MHNHHRQAFFQRHIFERVRSNKIFIAGLWVGNTVWPNSEIRGMICQD
jgi:hypothetical protein